MASKTRALILIFALSFGLSYLTEAHEETKLPDAETSLPIPLGAPSPSSNIGVETAFVNEMRDVIPKGEEFLKLMKKRIDETPMSSPSEKCLDSCLATYEKEIADLKKFTEVLLTSTNPGELDFDTTIEKAELEKCDGCLRDVAKEDPEFNQYTDWFFKMTTNVGELINKYNS